MPHAKHGLRLDLRTLILVLCALTALVMLCASYFASYRVQRQLLIDHALEANRVYAMKLASITETFIGNAQQQLRFSAGVQGRQLSDAAALLGETDRVLGQSMAFNSTFVIDANGVLRAVSPAPLRHLIGTLVQSPGAQEALHERRPLVSTPYLSAADNLVVALSHPMFDSDGRYLGYVGGSLYLRERNILNSLLGEHFYKDGSYLYVVDRNRRLLYHPNHERVGTVVEGNALIDQLATLDNGTRQITNSLGVEMLAGFATVPSAGWGVVAQQPLAQTVTPLNHLILNVVGTSAPLALVGCLLLWWLAMTIARPLWQLAAGARSMDRAGTAERLHRVRAWYFEAAELKRALLIGLNLLQERIGRLNRDAQTDPLTGLGNRRSLEFSLSLLEAEGRAFAAIVLDIDHFKQVNDKHGHEVGDQVLRRLAELMRRCCREGDLLCRTGGEEFLMLLPGASLDVATVVAERLRVTVQDTPVPPVGAVTVSLGVARWDGEAGSEPVEALSKADRALYLAKQSGRNRMCVA
ncbi:MULTISPECIES: sensor domain-containing diguanylate cyclase [Pseudomonas]|uniref:diguanylate cyclase n=2 Tax=Pseudomonas TaxID=286 RepID=A0A1L7NB02_PSEPU|nr:MULTISPECIES: sensor domain-containing diguanylate cyclase [Pseudomonas]PNB54167.1 GGDEF domain-containing protein [Pseudomonas sp. FW305-130]AGN78699.1 diguanylate cyclase [Pseudomonas putida H8234]EKT4453145.1 GGDEF domain-containing protein [Pseudomonas putida]EKT4562925.1 GGDEF domain-containing protein [Pseudomonas putida]MBH3470539.1 GGDEF domain-containing protein [Pseudomonas putida]